MMTSKENININFLFILYNMYNTKEQQEKIMSTCLEKEKKPKKQGEKIFYGKCGKKKSQCKCK